MVVRMLPRNVNRRGCTETPQVDSRATETPCRLCILGPTCTATYRQCLRVATWSSGHGVGSVDLNTRRNPAARFSRTSPVTSTLLTAEAYLAAHPPPAGLRLNPGSGTTRIGWQRPTTPGRHPCDAPPTHTGWCAGRSVAYVSGRRRSSEARRIERG